ncbi:cadmium resistance transporter [Spirulina sp. CCNP1310]|uniref:cadmium resistance transporter n=1 Tax=Spirulina sp. CCNP1310 TaxID=3110249 RepID=UPI002B1E9CDA|nr:cadmium resistance transporter [Spirulina sp. CCNP1310]MEA5419215.1 cadmium resistance transporter [Spirulina sp. CCNP1310]
MTWIFPTLTTAAIAFIATNLDDILLLIWLFAQVPQRFSITQILWGRYLSFVVLILLSLPGFFGGLLLPKPWLGLLGIIPILLGIHALVESEEESALELTGANRKTFLFLDPKIVSIAALTIANGGDNIAIYVSLFAGQTIPGLFLTLFTFFVFVGIWCGIAHLLVQHPVIGQKVRDIGHRFVPPLLIGLGLFILWENETYRLFTR